MNAFYLWWVSFIKQYTALSLMFKQTLLRRVPGVLRANRILSLCQDSEIDTGSFKAAGETEFKIKFFKNKSNHFLLVCHGTAVDSFQLYQTTRSSMWHSVSLID